MERLRRLAGLWSWLPAFRAVAETQHLPTASAELDVSASALSRTIRLLESDLGMALFEREGRRIVLNEAGERFLVAVRDAMRLVDDGIATMGTSSPMGPVHIASENAITDMVLEHAVSLACMEFPGLIPHVREGSSDDGLALLLRGDLDVVLTTAPRSDPNLVRVPLGSIATGVFAPAGHPAAAGAGFDPGSVAFVLWGRDADGAAADGWPASRPRTAAAVVARADTAISLAQRVGAVVVAPAPLAQDAVDRGSLIALAVEGLQPVAVYALHRRSLMTGGRAETIVEHARSAIALRLQ